MSKIEEVEKNIDKLKVRVGRNSIATNAGFQDTLTAVLSVVRPLLELIAGFFFVPKRWKKAIREFLQILDALPGSTIETFDA